jgi:hypothetical protein
VEWDDGIFYAATVAGYNQGSGKVRVQACVRALRRV